MSSTTTTADRRRQREDRGIRSTKTAKAAATTDRLPSAPRERRPLLAALAVVLIVGGAAVAALLAIRVDERVPVLVAARSIVAGQEITEDLVTTTPVASEGLGLVPEDEAGLVVGSFARVAIDEGQLIDRGMAISSPALADGIVSIGASLDAGRIPARGLQPGDIVRLISTETSTGETLYAEARISSFVSSGVDSMDGTAGGTVSLLVPESPAEDIDRLAAVIAADQLTVVLVDRGVPFQED